MKDQAHAIFLEFLFGLFLFIMKRALIDGQMRLSIQFSCQFKQRKKRFLKIFSLIITSSLGKHMKIIHYLSVAYPNFTCICSGSVGSLPSAFSVVNPLKVSTTPSRSEIEGYSAQNRAMPVHPNLQERKFRPITRNFRIWSNLFYDSQAIF